MPGQVPVFLIESAELLFQGSYARRGFDLEISGPDGTVVVIADYFSFDPPPSLMLADGSGNGFSPAMVKALLHDRFDGVLFAGPAEVPPALEQIGVVRFASGNVVRKNADTGEEGEPLQKGDPVFKGDEIIITGGGYVVATLDDGSRISQGPNSRATLDNFSFNENEQTGEFKAKVAFGGFNFKSGKIGTFAGASRDHTEISTPSAVIRIRGSEVDVNVDPATGDTLVRHQDGVLTVSDPNGLGAVQLVTSDTTTAVISGGLPANVGPSTPTQDAIFESALPPSNVMDSVDTTPPETEQTEISDGDKAPGPTEAPPEDAGETAEATGEAAEGEAEGEETTEEETDDETEDEADDSGEDSEDAADEESAEDTETAEDDTPTEEAAAEEAATEEGTGEAAADETAAEVSEAEGSEAEGSETETSEADGSEAESSEASSNAEGSAEGEAASDGSAGDGAESPGESAGEGSSSDADTAAEGSASDGGSSEGASGSGDAGGSESGTQGSTDSAVEPATSSGSTGTADAPLDLSPSGSDGSFSGSGATDSNTGSQTGTGSSDTGASGQPAVGTEPPAAPETQPELPPDTPPTSEDDAVTLAEGETLEISAEVLSNDEDPDQNQEPELASVNTTGTTGAVTLDAANQQLSYSADAAEFDSLAEGETATDTFEYTISSGIFTSTSTVTVTIEGKDDPANAVDDAYATDGGVDLIVDAANGLLANDTDPDASDTLTVIAAKVVSDDATEITFEADGSFAFLASGSDALNQLAAGEVFSSTIEYTVQSSSGGTVTATAVVTVTGANTAPEANDDTGATLENASTTIAVLDNDVDVDGDEITITAATVTGTLGTVAISGTDLIFTPISNLAEDESQVEEISYTISDGQLTSTGTVFVTVTGVNDAPKVIEQTPELTPSVDATSGPTDITSQVLAVIGDDSPGTEVTAVDNTNTLGLVELGSVIYSANGAFAFLNVGETFTDEFGFTATDIQGLNTDGVFRIDIEGVADAPVVSGPVTFNQTEDDGVVVLDLLTNASDPDTTDVLSVANFTATGDPSGVTLVGNMISVDTNAYTALGVGQSEVITLSYDVTDATGLSVAQTATLTITGVNDAPTVAPVALNFTQTDAITTNQSFLQGATDIDTGDSLSLTGLTLTGGLDNGVTLATDTFDIDPQVYSFLGAGETEVITYTFNVLDVSGASTPGTVSITVTGINDVPTTTNASVTATEDQPFTLGSASFSFADVDTTDTLQQVRIDSLPALGSLKLGGAAVSVGQTINIADITDGLLTYNSVLNGNGLAYASFDFSVGDGTAFSASSTITIDVTPVNDAPVVAPITATLAQSAGVTLQSLLDGASDAEGDTLTISNFILSGGLGSGIARVGTDLSIDPLFYNTLGGTESEVITYTFDVIDGNGGVTPNTATITINGENDLPSTGNNTLATPEDTPVSINSIDIPFTDPDSLDLFEGIRIDSLPPGALGVLKLSGVNVTVGQVISVVDMDNGLFTYLPNTNINDGDGIASFTFSAFDGDGFSIAPGTLTINVNPVNDAPVVAPITATLAQSAGVTLQSLLDGASDAEGDTLTISNFILSGGLGSGIARVGTDLSIDPLFYNTLGGTESEVITYTFDVIDGNGGVTPNTATITINGENDLPSTGNNTLATPEDTPVSINSIDIPFTDPDSLDLFEGIRIDSLPPGALGVLKLSGVNVTVGQVISVVDMDNGLFTYLPNTNINDGDGIASFTFSAFDGDGFSIAPGTLTINVNPVNDPPVAVADNYTVAFNGSLSATAGTNGLLDNDFDPEGETFTLNVTPVTGPTLGTISSGFLNGDGSFTYNPNFNFVGIDTFTYEVTDSNGASSIGTVTIDIVGGPGAVANSSGDFSDGSIFTSGTVPLATDDLFIDIGVSVDITELSPSPVTLLAVDIDGSGGFLGVTNNTLNVTNFITMGASSGLGVTDGVLTTGMSFTSDGFFTIENSDLTINTGVFSNSGTLEVTGNSSLAAPTSDNSSSLSLLGVPIYGSTQFSVSDGFDNLGTIDFKNDDTSARNISLNSAGTLSNQGTINILTGMGAGSRIIDVATFNNQGGLLNVDIGEVLDINADTTQVASDSQFNGSGAVRFNGTQTLSINDTSFGFVGTGGPTIEIGGAVTVSELGPPATFTIGTGATINILSAQSLTLNVDTVVNDGTIDLKGSLAATTLDVTNVTTFTNNGSIIGTGTIVDPSMVISGPGTVSVAPGSSPGILTFDGGLNTAIELETELEGLTPGSGHDQLQVIGDANIYSSQMDLILLNGFMPEIGDSFVVFTANSLTGHFGVVTGLDIASDRVLDIIYDGDDVVLIAVATTEIGTEAADTLVGSSEQDVVVAGGGDDQIISGIGSDMVFGQVGNDTIEVASDFSRVDGGAGIDRLIVTQFNEDDGSRVDNVEVLDIGDGDAALSATTISEVVSGTNDITGLADSLVLDGDSGSTVTLVGEFAYDRSEQLDSGNGLSDYDVYIDNGASIFVLQGVLVAHQAVMESGSVAAPLDLSGVDSLVAKQETDHTLAPTSEVALTDIFGEQDPLSELLAALPGESSAGSTFAAPVGGVAIAGGTSISALHGELLPLDYHHSEV